MNEIAAPMLDPSIVSQARLAAQAYPDLKILCPWCRDSVLGLAFEEHAQEHEQKTTTMKDARSFGVWVDAIWKGIDGVGDDALASAAGFILQAGSVVTAGNGGSASLASHFAQAVMKPDYKAGGAARAAVCVNDNVPTLTAHANDGGWTDALLETAKPLFQAMPRCVVVLFSSSGKSENVVRLARYALEKGHKVIAFTGFDGGELKKLATVSLHVESKDYECIEPCHSALMHRVQYHLRRLG